MLLIRIRTKIQSLIGKDSALQFSSVNVVFNRETEHTFIVQYLYATITPGPLERTFGPTQPYSEIHLRRLLGIAAGEKN